MATTSSGAVNAPDWRTFAAGVGHGVVGATVGNGIRKDRPCREGDTCNHGYAQDTQHDDSNASKRPSAASWII